VLNSQNMIGDRTAFGEIVSGLSMERWNASVKRREPYRQSIFLFENAYVKYIVYKFCKNIMR